MHYRIKLASSLVEKENEVDVLCRISTREVLET